MWSGLPYVKIHSLLQYCSSPARQFTQVRHDITMQPTAAMSPSLNFFTFFPTATTRPTISCPGTTGYTAGITSFHSLREKCKSEWHTPQYKISICTSSASGLRRSKLYGDNPDVALFAAYAFAANVSGF